jgi:hypothetical protein
VVMDVNGSDEILRSGECELILGSRILTAEK